jgi:hypothetical protein
MPNIGRSGHEAWRKTSNENVRQWMLNILDIAFPGKQISAKNFEALWRTFICNKTKHRTVLGLEYGEYFAELVRSLATNAWERRPNSEDPNNHLQSPCVIGQETTEPTAEELQAQEYNQSYRI